MSLGHAMLLQSCPTLCDPMNYSLPGFSVYEIFWQEYWSGLPFPPPGDLPDPEILMSPALGGSSFATSAIWEAQVSLSFTK